MNTINRNKVKTFCNFISVAKHITIFIHINPDGDTVGSALALTEIFKSMNIEVSVISSNTIPTNLQWMPNIENVSTNLPERDVKTICDRTDLIICVDFSQYERADKYAAILEKNNDKKIIVIDHHINPNIRCNLLISSINVSSSCELVYQLIKQAKLTMNTNFANCIYVGITTDTGNFSYSSSQIQTFETVIGLLKLGLDKDNITNRIYKNQPADQVKLLGYTINKRLIIMPEIHTAYMYLTLKDQLKFNYQPGYSENFVNYPLSIDGIRLSAFFVENKKHIRISFRSEGDFDVNILAKQYFNGGGHKNASGGKRLDSLKEVIDDFKKLAAQYADQI